MVNFMMTDISIASLFPRPLPKKAITTTGAREGPKNASNVSRWLLSQVGDALPAIAYRRVDDRQLVGAKWHLATKQHPAVRDRGWAAEPQSRRSSAWPCGALAGLVGHRLCETGGDLLGFV